MDGNGLFSTRSTDRAADIIKRIWIKMYSFWKHNLHFWYYNEKKKCIHRKSGRLLHPLNYFIFNNSQRTTINSLLTTFNVIGRVYTNNPHVYTRALDSSLSFSIRLITIQPDAQKSREPPLQRAPLSQPNEITTIPSRSAPLGRINSLTVRSYFGILVAALFLRAGRRTSFFPANKLSSSPLLLASREKREKTRK